MEDVNILIKRSESARHKLNKAINDDKSKKVLRDYFLELLILTDKVIGSYSKSFNQEKSKNLILLGQLGKDELAGYTNRQL